MLALLLMIPLLGTQPGTMGWPLGYLTRITSQFCEYRGVRFHGGVDFSTYRRRGLPVRAAADGYIYRIKYAHAGLGKALYVKHAGGLITVYGHLLRFENRYLHLEDLVARLQRKTGKKYFGDYYLEKPLFVRKGQVIAYSGSSGAGPAHLHFEVRKGESRPVNPLVYLPAFRGKEVRVREVVFITGDWTSHAGYKRGLMRLFPVKAGPHSYRVRNPIPVEGCFRLAVRAYEKCGSTCGLLRVEAFFDGKPVYTWEARSFSYSENYRAGYIYNLLFSRSGRFYYNIPALNLPPLCVKEGIHTLTLYLKGSAERPARLELRLVHSPGFYARLRKEEGKLKLDVAEGFRVKARCLVKGRWVRLMLRGRELSLPDGAVFLQVKGYRNGFSSPWITLPLENPEKEAKGPQPRLSLFATLGWKKLEADFPFVLPGFPSFCSQQRCWAILPPDYPLGEFKIYTAEGVRRVKLREKVFSLPGRADFGFGYIEAAQQSYFRTFPLSVREIDPGESELPVASRAVRIMPLEVGLAKPAEVGFYLSRPGSKMAVFMRRSGNGSWICLRSRVLADRVVARTRQFGDFVVMEDTEPPLIKPLFPKPGRTYRKVSVIKAIVRDEGCGVDPERIYFYIDGKRYVPDHDWDSGLAEQPVELSPGLHRLLIIAYDFKGNANVWEGYFRIRKQGVKRR